MNLDKSLFQCYGSYADKKLNMKFTERELRELRALVYKEIMNYEREKNPYEALLFREIYEKLKRG